MTEEEVYASLDEMLKNHKSRNFLNHLVRAYMPVSNIVKVIDKQEGDFNCAISRQPLISTQEILDGIHTDEFKADVMLSLKTMFDDKSDKKTAMEKLVDDKLIGLTGKNTTTFLSATVANSLVNWVMNKALTGDKHINWLIGSIRHSSFSTKANSLGDDAKKKLKKISDNNDRTAKFQLGDTNSALAALKAKMEGKS